MDLATLKIPEFLRLVYMRALLVEGVWVFAKKKPENYTGVCVTYVDGVWHKKTLYLDGQQHCLERAAEITHDGYTCYYQYGLMHRIKAPAITKDRDNYSYFFYDMCHRTDGEASACLGSHHYSLLGFRIDRASTIVIVK